VRGERGGMGEGEERSEASGATGFSWPFRDLLGSRNVSTEYAVLWRNWHCFSFLHTEKTSTSSIFVWSTRTNNKESVKFTPKNKQV
jgi:hypothetical protein